MEALIEHFGIDWKILLIQILNFAIVLVAFTFLIYKPLVKYIAERKEKREAGLIKEEEASKRFSEIVNLEREKMRLAEDRASSIIANAQKKAQVEEAEIIKRANDKGKSAYTKALDEIKTEKDTAMKSAEKNIAVLVKEVLSKFVKLNPAATDEVLIKKAIEEASK